MKKVLLTVMMLFSIICAQVKIEEGVIAGAKYYTAIPEHWNKKLLILAHGLRPEKAPLTAEFSVDNRFYKSLLDKGWMIASTSYRRNGLIVRDAVEDIDLLKEHIIKNHSKPEKTFLIGSSMGGAIAVYIAENRTVNEYSGVLGIGAAIFCIEREKPYKYTFSPNMPLLFISNQNELTSPQSYTEKAVSSAFQPATWFVRRDGHCNIRDDEKERAFKALINYSQTSQFEQNRDVTADISEQKSKALFRDEKSYAKIYNIHPSYGNFMTEFVKSDLKTLGIKHNSYFHIGMNDKTFKIYLGSTYSDVPRGDWIAFFTAEGYLQIARNFESAVELLECKNGDLLSIQK